MCGLDESGQMIASSRVSKTNTGGFTMRISLKKLITAFAALALLATGSAFASPAPSTASTAHLSGRATTLLAEIQTEAAALRPRAETLATFAWNPRMSWQSHAFYLERVKGHINAVGERLAELQQIRGSVLPWQQEAISRVTSHAAQVAASTQAAIVYLGENQGRLFVPDYRDHLTTIADRSEDMHQTVSKFLNYDKAQQQFQQLQQELELAI
jgi:hypothetical protein